MFYCSNGLRIDWSLACDGNMDCLDGSDESKDLCSRYEYGTNISMDCGTVDSKGSKQEHFLEAIPWIVDIYAMKKESNEYYYSAAKNFLGFRISDSQFLFKIDIPLQTDHDNNRYYIDIAGTQLNGTQHVHTHTVFERFFSHIDNNSCIVRNTPGYGSQTLIYFKYCIRLQFDINYYVPIIRGILNKHSTANSCVIPTVEGVVHSYEGSHSILSPGALIDPNTTVIESCKVGYHKAHLNGFRVCQIYGIWKTYSEKLCLKMCPPLLSDSLDIKCSYNDSYANCSNPSIPDTIATTKCKSAYALPNGQKETTIELHCQSNGMWNNELYICEPECGKTFVNNQVLIANGKKANIGTAPWNVAIYEQNSNYDLICGGSIISRNLVVSAAHCFSKSVTENITIIVNDGLYKIAAGKYDRNFRNIDSEITKLMNVDKIYLKESYFGASGYYAEDIAVVVLQNSFSFSNSITPICMDWNGKYNVSNGDEGKVVGWGVMENHTVSPVLLETGLPYIDIRSCWSMCTYGFKSFVTTDKFCAGSSNGHGVDNGDSGAGLCFLHSNFYYLTGVVSLKDPDANNSISLYTSVKYHIQWIRRLYIEYKKYK
ncbi:unnamed protein product [Macrosiphum euphorbiae]|uniref:Uncharacterized protein n=1 Tax=Macrosiphum euphorbiae TaxID=13131 RepID=A0AAV0W491_9HEMI|nr:unnamed protein product [Macrosiphum euphorbiae]